MAELKWDIPALHRHLQGVVAMLATDPALARHEKLADPVCWRASLPKTRHVMPALGRVPATPELIAKAAPSSLASPICGPGWLAVGDAASVYDPLLAQGIYKALAAGYHGGIAAADGLAGNVDTLRAYNRFVVTGFTDFLQNYSYLYGLSKAAGPTRRSGNLGALRFRPNRARRLPE